MYVSYDNHDIIRATSLSLIRSPGQTTICTPDIGDTDKVVGKKLVLGRNSNELKIALICNWGDRCGIANYTTHLLGSLRSKVSEIKIFAEEIADSDPVQDKEAGVVRCWRRGTSMISCIRQIIEWKPDLVFIQHEFGIFPKATHFLKMLEMLEPLPYVMTMHSVYEHLDKTICTAYIKNMIVHSEEGKASLHRNGHLNNIHVIYHGCVEYSDHSELWNIFQNDYSIIQFGFGFNYKGVDVAIDAIDHLRRSHDKFKDIFYCYMCTESPHTRVIQQDYYNYLSDKVNALGLHENVVIMRGFLSEKYISNFLRTAKLAIFPYKNDLHNTVYGASGAIRNAMANAIPIIASDCHLFDDVQNVVPRIGTHIQLADEIDKILSNSEYRQGLVQRNLRYVHENNWNATADKHVEIFKKIVSDHEAGVIRVQNYELV